jgi:hypothetical protein
MRAFVALSGLGVLIAASLAFGASPSHSASKGSAAASRPSKGIGAPPPSRAPARPPGKGLTTGPSGKGGTARQVWGPASCRTCQRQFESCLVDPTKDIESCNQKMEKCYRMCRGGPPRQAK